jgi:hemolysin activation/secretion protein
MLAAAAMAAALACAPSAAQVPPAATPGGALPRVQQPVPPVPPKAELFNIPPVFDRPLGLDEGPRIVVRAFRLDGAQDRPKHAVRVAELQSLLEAARAGQPAQGFSINQLQQVAAKLAEYYHTHGYILAQAFVPAQDVANGEVTVRVLEGKLGKVVVEGNKHYPAATLQRPFRALIGAPVDKDAMESALLTLTNYPGLTAFGVLGAGQEVGTTNLTLRVQSEERLRLEMSVDNYGSRFAGEYRGTVTLTVNDPLHLADRLQLIGLYGMDSSGASGHGLYGGANYEIPVFSPNDFLRFFHVTNSYDVAASASIPANSTGNTRIDEVGYRHDFDRTRLGSASVGLAFNVKASQFRSPPSTLFDDKLTTARLDLLWNRVDTLFHGVNQASLSYTHGFDDLLGSLGRYNPLAAAGASRLGADGRFDKVVVDLQRLQQLPQNLSLMVRVNGQYTPDPLVSLEQLSLGGADSVRAYSPSEVLAEKGGWATLELISPVPLLGSHPAFGGRTWGQILQLSVFTDYGVGVMNSPLVGSQQSETRLGGAGGAVQLSIPGRVFARLDVAAPLTRLKAGNGRDPQIYFRLGTSF